MTPYKCKKCGHEIESETRPPDCLECGGNSFHAQVAGQAISRVSTHASVLAGDEDGKAKGFSESERDGRTTSASSDDNGTISYSFAGTAPQGEEDTMTTGRVLLQAMNARGYSWINLRELNAHWADCEATDEHDNKKKLWIQVVRAITAQQFWKEVQGSGKISRSSQPKDLACQLKEAVEHKNADLPESSRPRVTLALDATRLAALAFDEVVLEFKKQFGSWAASLGYDSIWLVGPLPALTHRLDQSS